MSEKSRIATAVRAALLATSAASLAFSTQVWSAEEDTSKNEEAEEQQKVVVTGSRIKRNQAESAQPVVVITNDDMQARGYVTVFEALNDLSQNTGVQLEGAETGGFTPNVETLNFRGFGVGTQLTLINGRRVASYPAAYQSDGTVFNFGAIPSAAVDRIEILTTGASAIYGSDAIAGVVNIILRQDVDDVIANVLYGQQGAGKATTRVQLLAGKSFESGNITFAYEYQDREGVYGSDYSKYDSELDYPFGDGVLTRGVLDLNNYHQFGDRSLGDLRYVTPPAGACSTLGMVDATRPDAGEFCGLDYAQSHSFRNPSTKHSVFVDGRYELNNDLEMFGTVLYHQSDAERRRDYLTISEDTLDPTNLNATYGLPQWSLTQRRFTSAELGRDLSTQFEDKSISLIAGLRGMWGTHDWELTFNHSNYEFNSSEVRFVSQEVIDIFLGDFWNLPGTLSWIDGWDGQGEWGLIDNLYNPLPSQYADRLVGNQTYGNETSTQQAQFTMSGELGEMDAGPIGYAFVAEFENTEIEMKPDAGLLQEPPHPNASGSYWWGLTGYEGQGERDRVALGLEVSIPVADNFTVNLAGRFDSYDSTSSSIGTRFTPAANFEWRPEDSLLIRGGYSGSFRAPDLNLVFVRSGFYTRATDYTACFEQFIADGGDSANFDVTDCESQGIFALRNPANLISDTAEALRDETGYSMFLGFVKDITDDTSLTMTWNEQYLKDQAATESIQGLLNDDYTCKYGNEVGQTQLQRDLREAGRCDYVAARISRTTETDLNGNTISELDDFSASPINTAETRIQSFDISLTSNWDTEFGTFSTNLDYSNVMKLINKNTPESGWFNARDTRGFAQTFRSRFSGSITYENGDFSTTLTGIRRGSTPKRNRSEVDEAAGDAPRLGPHITYNYTASYFFNDDMRLRLRVANLFDSEPPSDSTHYFYQYPWYNIYMYGGAGLGREWSLEAEYRF
ncbi:TonB-dependent receptor domain-containing protein [Pleionea sp. CnH1-48]|uniref:TonB-dependent receptor domain-containing protein n=1 Tax=Pleionea sp. CnH1-48 TaxID=2954494 RepID=UPI002096BFFA|nr:TonB-dependent receptor [Pleionea sp. CnH1-48]MCO7227087.1 TonB-dependent receptor [Pleionea sp. CnH1-48]